MKHSMIKPVLAAALAAVMFFGNVTTGYAYSNTDEVNSVGWSELEDTNSLQKSKNVSSLKNLDGEVSVAEFGLPQWVLRGDGTYEFSNGKIRLLSYTMELLNDLKLCKGTTSHSNYMLGYVRARFETIFGEVHEGSDSMRVRSYYGATAETPSHPIDEGWAGIAHTYCGAE